MDDGASGLVLVMVDGHSGETTPDFTFVVHIYLDFWAKVLPQEVSSSTSSNPCTDHGCKQE